MIQRYSTKLESAAGVLSAMRGKTTHALTGISLPQTVMGTLCTYGALVQSLYLSAIDVSRRYGSAEPKRVRRPNSPSSRFQGQY